ncbi:hypothetical protein AGMMS50249_7740 [candidate division SR1 bacterium]|nr:hypothetical protein AGMMS50249_7740 [candidate division SR1 bacterium]
MAYELLSFMQKGNYINFPLILGIKFIYIVALRVKTQVKLDLSCYGILFLGITKDSQRYMPNNELLFSQ